MKTLMTLLICITLTATVACKYTQSIESEKNISLKLLEERVFAQYGSGDAGVEEMLYLTTGIHQDFMGNENEEVSRVFNYDYQICLNDSFTVVYDVYGKFVTSVPYVQGSAWDEAMSWENL